MEEYICHYFRYIVTLEMVHQHHYIKMALVFLWEAAKWFRENLIYQIYDFKRLATWVRPGKHLLSFSNADLGKKFEKWIEMY